ncbi:heat shock protein Hsp20 [Methylobacterium sp. 4-46]|nr:heat shock protein Hsp20 [Methylobacterium sp. 4-46]
MMRNADLSPLSRLTVGFDRLFDLMEQAGRVEPMSGWPPYDIEKLAEDRYRITMAVAGFGADEITLTQSGPALLVSGQRAGSEEGRDFLHRGIAGRSFRHSFSLADHVTVTGARLEHGLLAIDLVREVPETLKPRRVPIGTAAQAPAAPRAEAA